MSQIKYDNKFLNQIEKSEIFHLICSNLNDIGFTNNINYFLFRRRFFRFFLLTVNTKAINKKFKMTRFDLKYGSNSGYLTGFYRAIW